MKIKMKAVGLTELIAGLRHGAESVPDKARKTMHRGAEKILKEAVLNAPVDDAELEDSGHIVKGYEMRGRLKIDVVFGGIVRGVDVDRYAMQIHENYEGMLRKGPGPGTLAKMAANPGRIIGSKFLQRAVDAEESKLKASLLKASVTELKNVL